MQNFAVTTPMGNVKEITSRKELSAFILEEKKEIYALEKMGFTYKKIKKIDQSLEIVNQLYNSHVELAVQKISPLDLSLVRPPEVKPAYLQVLAGNNKFYIGACTSAGIVNKAIKNFLNDTPFSEMQIQLSTQPHITIVPPSHTILPSLALNQVAEVKPFDLEFDRISLSRKGNVNLWAKNSDSYHEVSAGIAAALGVEKNTREPHTKICMLALNQVSLIFMEPEKFGFEVIEERVFKKLDSPLKESIVFSEKDYNEEQMLLKSQYEGTTQLSRGEIAKSKEIFKNRIFRINQLHEHIKGFSYQDKKNANLPFNWDKLILAIEGDPHVGRVPLTFSCRENGVLLWKKFCNDISKVIDRSTYDDITIQMLGSGVHGFSRNLTKKLKSWTYDSDGDLAIFSRKMSLDCLKLGVQVNEGVQLHGRFILFKNERNPSKEGIGFYDTEIGKQFSRLQEKWSEKLYGKERATGEGIDFKLNINPVPFRDAIKINEKIGKSPRSVASTPSPRSVASTSTPSLRSVTSTPSPRSVNSSPNLNPKPVLLDSPFWNLDSESSSDSSQEIEANPQDVDSSQQS